jgi:hypothetical protein
LGLTLFERQGQRAGLDLTRSRRHISGSTRSCSTVRNLTTEQMRRGVFASMPELVTAIYEYVAHHNIHPKLLIRAKSVRDIL